MAGGGRGRFRAIVVERANAGICPDNILQGDGFCEILAGEVQQIVAFRIGTDRILGGALVILICGANQGEVLLIGDSKDDPPVGALKEIAFVMIE